MCSAWWRCGPACWSSTAAPCCSATSAIADAYYAPVCMRLHSYGLPVPPHIQAYVQRVRALPGVKAWIDGALAEQDFREFEEPYRLAR
jgi:glutathione S-transferase